MIMMVSTDCSAQTRLPCIDIIMVIVRGCGTRYHQYGYHHHTVTDRQTGRQFCLEQKLPTSKASPRDMLVVALLASVLLAS